MRTFGAAGSYFGRGLILVVVFRWNQFAMNILNTQIEGFAVEKEFPAVAA